MKKIKLTQGKYALVDDEDYEELNKYTWCYNKGYAFRWRSGVGMYYMHREILGTPKGVYTDHINSNGIDNRRKNLRMCTQQQNTWNKKVRNDSKSGIKGVSPSKNNRWVAKIRSNKIIYHLGTFNSKKAASLAYRKKAKELYGEFARR